MNKSIEMGRPSCASLDEEKSQEKAIHSTQKKGNDVRNKKELTETK